MTPVTFDQCAGWLDIGAGGTGIVICAPFGREGMLTYRGCKILADRLHARGFSVLRFDYPGTGDSGGTETDPDRVAAWQGGIAAAISFLRQTTSCTDVILVGLRLGAALALMAASSDASIVAVCCLSPVVSGRSYTRELRLLANGWREANLLSAPSTNIADLEIVGDRLDSETLRTLSAIDLRTLKRSAPEVLLLDPGTPLLDDLAERLQTLGASVTREDFPGAVEFLQNPFADSLPLQTFEILTSWCVGLTDRATAAPSQPKSVASFPVLAGMLRTPEAIEEGVRFGLDKELYGVFCQPIRQRNATMPAVMMLNTGFGRRTGDGRVFVTLARRLAGLGICSLRIDVRGCGESAGRADGTAEPYAPDLVDDVVAAANELGHRGFDRLVLVGICSGAHAAFHAGLRDPRVTGMILINLQKFIWQAGAPLSVQNSRQRRPVTFYLRSIMRREAWLRVFKGKIAVGAITIALLQRLVARSCNEGFLLLERLAGVPTRAGQVRRWLVGLGMRGVQVDLLYSDGDPGLSELAVEVGSSPGSFRNLPHVLVEVIPQADHALLDHAARQRFIDRACRLVQDFGPAS